MKKQGGIWIDKEKAVLVTLVQGNHTLNTLASDLGIKERFDGEVKEGGRFGNQYLSSEHKKENKLHHQTQHFLDEVIQATLEMEEVVIFGPAEMKNELGKRMNSKHEWSNRPIEIKTADSMTDNQLVAWVKDFYA